jgi:5,5'-dehydrodivanillate O-demethylase
VQFVTRDPNAGQHAPRGAILEREAERRLANGVLECGNDVLARRLAHHAKERVDVAFALTISTDISPFRGISPNRQNFGTNFTISLAAWRLSSLALRPRSRSFLHTAGNSVPREDAMENAQPTRQELLRQLTQTAAGTLMGTLLRSFWQPIAVADSIAPGTARALRVLSEDLTLYRGQKGTPFLIGAHCAHRCTVLHTGWVEGDQIRCMYHGWRYDGNGQCTEMPAERQANSELVKIEGYPVYEYAGLLFAYLGPAPAPAFDLPRKPALEDPTRLRAIRYQVWDYNFFQGTENSLDATHVSYVHVWGKVSRFGDEITTALPELSYEETSAGIRQTAYRSATNIRISDWTFPNNNHIVSPGPRKGDPWNDNATWHVPIDDEHTMRFAITTAPSTDPETDRRFLGDRADGYNPAEHYRELFEEHRIPEGIGTGQVISTQDYVALRGQGVIVDRSQERLGQSDAGIALLRRIFLRELDAIRTGRPAKTWTRLLEAVDLPIQRPQPASA